jgi:hypothetical protein
MIQRKIKSTRKRYLVMVLVAMVVISTILVLLHNSKYSATTIPSKPSSQSSSDKTPSTSQPSSSSTGSAAQPDKNASNLTTTGSGPTKPFGNFVSNHSPGGGSPTQEKSTCNTTPGASCVVQFTMGSITKKLDAQTADSSGATYWTWDVKEAGLSEGSWQITAIASLNGQTTTTQDQTLLKILP